MTGGEDFAWADSDAEPSYEPEQRDRADDAINARVFHAWREWGDSLAALEAQRGERLPPAARGKARREFAEALFRAYGRSEPNASWLAYRREWQERREERGRWRR